MLQLALAATPPPNLLSPRERGRLMALRSPAQIQAYLNRITSNHEIGGETVLSVQEVLRQRRAHCIEGAFFAAFAFWLQGERPLVMHLDCDYSDYPHVIALFQRDGHWGAISKTNGPRLRYRDPVYRSLRELALSYFHEYTDKHGNKTLRSYSGAFDLRRLDPRLWVDGGEQCWQAHDRLVALRHYPLVSTRQLRALAPMDPFDLRASKALEHPPPDRKRARHR